MGILFSIMITISLASATTTISDLGVFSDNIYAGDINVTNNLTVGWYADYYNQITKRNEHGYIYISGDELTEGSQILSIDNATGYIQIRKLEDTLWQPGSMQIATSTLWIGPNVGVAAIGHNLATESADGHLHLFSRDGFDGQLSNGETRILYAYEYIERVEYQPDNSGTWIGTTQEFTLYSPAHLLINDGYFQTDIIPATESITYRIWKGENDSGDMIFEQAYPSSEFPALTEIQVMAKGFLEFEENKTYFHRLSSDANFSLKTDVTGNYAWIAADTSFVREDILFQTQQWANGTNFSDGQYLIYNRTIYVASEAGVQTGTFESNSDKWNDIGNSTAMNYWTKTGNDLSYSSGDVNVSNGDVYISVGNINAYGKSGITTNFIGGLGAGFSMFDGFANTLIGYDVGNHLMGDNQNTFIGFKAGTNSAGLSDAVALGSFALDNADGAYRTIGIGSYTGVNATSADGVYIGYKAGSGETTPSKFWLSNNDGHLMEGSFADEWLHVYGDLSVEPNFSLGIGTNRPNANLHIVGSFLQTVIDPTFTGEILSSRLGGTKSAYVSGKYAYVTSFGHNSLQIIDISNPSNPTFAGELQNSSRLNDALSVHVSGKYAYVTAFNDDSLQIIDISDPSYPSFAGELKSSRLNGIWGVYVSGKYAYVTTNYNDSLEIIDISNPSNPIFVGGLSSSRLDSAQGIYISGEYAYITAYGHNSLQIIDISNNSNPTFVGQLVDSNRLHGAHSLYVSGKNAYVTSSKNNSLQIIDISNSSNPVFAGQLENSTRLNRPESVYISGKYAYVTSILSNSLSVIDISNSSNLTFAGHLENSSRLDEPTSVYVSGKYAYVTSSVNNSLQVIDIGGIDSPSATIGDLAVGTLDVWENLHIANDLYVGSGLTVGPNGIYSQGDVCIRGVCLGEINGSLWNKDGNDISFTSGNVGIGMANPGAKLIVKTGIAEDGIYLVDGSDWVKTRIAINGNNDGYLKIMDRTHADIVLFTSEPNADSYINNGGNFGIGTTSPTQALDVNGSINISGNFTMTGSMNVIENITADYFIGNGSLLTGMEVVSAKAKIYVNEGPTYVTTIGTIGVFTPVNGSWTSGTLEEFSMTSDGNITYTGSDSITVFANGKITVVAGGTDQAISLTFKKNGAVLSNSYGENHISSDDPVSLYSQDMISLSNGDMLKLYVANTDSTNDITLYNSNIILFEI